MLKIETHRLKISLTPPQPGPTCACMCIHGKYVKEGSLGLSKFNFNSMVFSLNSLIKLIYRYRFNNFHCDLCKKSFPANFTSLLSLHANVALSN